MTHFDFGLIPTALLDAALSQQYAGHSSRVYTTMSRAYFHFQRSLARVVAFRLVFQREDLRQSASNEGRFQQMHASCKTPAIALT